MNSMLNDEKLQTVYNNCKNNPDFAYWIGVVQSDGHFKRQIQRNGLRIRYLITLRIGKKSLPMLERFREISRELFLIKGSSYTYTTPEGFKSWNYDFGCKNLIPIFEAFKINFREASPPGWVAQKDKLLGAYLAGVIDGDGDIRLTTRKNPQCLIRISSGEPLTNLTNIIRLKLQCGANIQKRVKKSRIAARTFTSTWCRTEFSVNKKNAYFIKHYLVNYLSLPHKKEKILIKFEKWGGKRDLNPHQ